MYDQCAKFYDTPLRDRFSHQCFKVAQKILAGRSIIAPAPVVDLGCGTGQLCRLLQKAGFTVTGVDLSNSMLELAQTIPPHTLLPCEWVQHDICTFQRNSEFKAAFCFGDVLNHLLETTQLAQLFSSVHHSLRPGGVFIADSTTLEAYCSTLWNQSEIRENRDDLELTLSSAFDQKKNIGWIQVIATRGSEVTKERTVQKYHPEHTVEKLLKDAGFPTVIRQPFDPLPELSAGRTIKNIWLALKS